MNEVEIAEALFDLATAIGSGAPNAHNSPWNTHTHTHHSRLCFQRDAASRAAAAGGGKGRSPTTRDDVPFPSKRRRVRPAKVRVLKNCVRRGPAAHLRLPPACALMPRPVSATRSWTTVTTTRGSSLRQPRPPRSGARLACPCVASQPTSHDSEAQTRAQDWGSRPWPQRCAADAPPQQRSRHGRSRSGRCDGP